MSREEAICEEAVARLGEHFDAVQIFVSLPMDGGGTRCIKKGGGNWYARQGMAHEFINEDMAQEIAVKVNEGRPDDDTPFSG